MKTVRFSEVVKRCGAPEPHLVLVAPAKDKTLQTAVKAQRVMTLVQATTGTKTDYGNIGFTAGGSRQYLIFPKSLRAFAGRKVVGIKYDLLSAEEIPKSQRARPPKPPKRSARKKPVIRAVRASKSPRRSSKVIPFHSPDRDEEEENDDIRQMKRLARQAMDALEDGKQVAAFNLLKRILTI